MQKNLKKLLATLPIIFLTSCAGLPKAPSVELGVIDYPRGQVIVNMTGRSSFKNVDSIPAADYRSVVKAIVSGGNRVPLASYDRAISFKPAEWQKVQSYMDSLVQYVRAHCGN